MSWFVNALLVFQNVVTEREFYCVDVVRRSGASHSTEFSAANEKLRSWFVQWPVVVKSISNVQCSSVHVHVQKAHSTRANCRHVANAKSIVSSASERSERFRLGNGAGFLHTNEHIGQPSECVEHRRLERPRKMTVLSTAGMCRTMTG